VSRHLTHRFWFCALIGFTTAGATLMARAMEPAALGAPFLGVLLLSLIDGWWRPVEVATPTVSSPRVVEGDELTFNIQLTTSQPIPWVELEIQFPATLEPIGPTRFVTPLDGHRTFTVAVRARRWGAAGPEWAVVTTRDRFGVSELVSRHPLHLPVRIHPPSERLASLVPLYRERPVTGEHRSRRTGPGAELAEVRPYRYGDPVRMIHPRLSSRRQSPMVVERHPDQSSDIILLVDSAQDLGVDLDTTLRWTVTTATALAERHLRAQDRVGLIDVGRGVRWLPARLGRRHLHDVVDALLSTEVLPRHQRDQAFVMPTNLPRSATIIAISPLLTEMVLTALVELRGRGHEVIVIKPPVPDAPDDDSISLLARRVFRAGNELNERWLVERGAVVVPWATGDSLEHLMRRVMGNLGRARQRR
jgi:uncharacterized protein (DUF58 family)